MKVTTSDGLPQVRLGSKDLQPADAIDMLKHRIVQAEQLVSDAALKLDKVRQQHNMALIGGTVFERGALSAAERKLADAQATRGRTSSCPMNRHRVQSQYWRRLCRLTHVFRHSGETCTINHVG